MRRIAILFLAALPVLCQTQKPADEAGVRALVARYVDARERRDAQAIEALFTPEADQLVSSGEWRKGRPSISKPRSQRSPASGK